MSTKLLRASVEIIIPKGDKFLVVTNRRWGGFSMPGGKVEENESLEQAAHRELLEETGLKGKLTFIAAGFTPAKTPGEKDWCCFSYLAEVDGTCSVCGKTWLGSLSNWPNHDTLVQNGCHGCFVPDEPKQVEEGTVPFWATRIELRTSSMYPEHYDWLLRLL